MFLSFFGFSCCFRNRSTLRDLHAGPKQNRLVWTVWGVEFFFLVFSLFFSQCSSTDSDKGSLSLSRKRDRSGAKQISERPGQIMFAWQRRVNVSGLLFPDTWWWYGTIDPLPCCAALLRQIEHWTFQFRVDVQFLLSFRIFRVESFPFVFVFAEKEYSTWVVARRTRNLKQFATCAAVTLGTMCIAAAHRYHLAPCAPVLLVSDTATR